MVTRPTAAATALIYVRVSRLDDDERERKISPEMQRGKAAMLRELAGLAVETFEDLDISGKSATNRPAYQRLLTRLRGGGVRYVVGYDLSRITRSVGDQADFFTELEHAGAVFLEASTGRTIDPNDENDELSANVLGSVNQHYRRALGRRVRDALAAKVERGELVGPVPAGYIRRRTVLENGKIARNWVEADPEKAPVVQLLFQEYATGVYSLKGLARAMNARGIPQPRSTHFRNNRTAAQIWTADVVKDILANPRYAGHVPGRDGTLHQGHYPALVDDSTWAACQRVRIRRRAAGLSFGRSRSPRWSTPYLLSSVLRCSRCGSTMSGETRRPDRTHPQPRQHYTCYRRRTAQACDAPFVAQTILETQLLQILRTVSAPAGFFESIEADARGLAGLATARAKLSRRQFDERLKRLTFMLELGDLSPEDYLSRRDALQALVSAGQPAGSSTLEGQQKALAGFIDAWPEMTIEERKRVVAAVFQEIRANEDGISRFLPRDDWKRFVTAVVGVLSAPRGVTERKTGLKALDVETVQLLQDSRGWLRLAG
ncbi:MAG TPA: hypothetical protein DCK98_09130 [Chloroflexi bacterium]|jgi:DNA invertase Pin-like site-specific DNA recombinase|nr:hypothetical protein [Chloroflexota bacterium]HAL27677.1 hypothetical protein [Chloroflexota bacterium]